MVNSFKLPTLNIVQVDFWTKLWYDEISIYGQLKWLKYKNDFNKNYFA